jgi:hypothetical protein
MIKIICQELILIVPHVAWFKRYLQGKYSDGFRWCKWNSMLYKYFIKKNYI